MNLDIIEMHLNKIKSYKGDNYLVAHDVAISVKAIADCVKVKFNSDIKKLINNLFKDEDVEYINGILNFFAHPNFDKRKAEKKAIESLNSSFRLLYAIIEEFDLDPTALSSNVFEGCTLECSGFRDEIEFIFKDSKIPAIEAGDYLGTIMHKKFMGMVGGLPFYEISTYYSTYGVMQKVYRKMYCLGKAPIRKQILMKRKIINNGSLKFDIVYDWSTNEQTSKDSIKLLSVEFKKFKIDLGDNFEHNFENYINLTTGKIDWTQKPELFRFLSAARFNDSKSIMDILAVSRKKYITFLKQPYTWKSNKPTFSWIEVNMMEPLFTSSAIKSYHAKKLDDNILSNPWIESNKTDEINKVTEFTWGNVYKGAFTWMKYKPVKVKNLITSYETDQMHKIFMEWNKNNDVIHNIKNLDLYDKNNAVVGKINYKLSRINIITGNAGTGKSLHLVSIAKEIMSLGDEIIIVSPTHKSASVLNEYDSNIEVITIQGISSCFKGNSEKQLNITNKLQGKVLFLDEFSMYTSTDIFNLSSIDWKALVIIGDPDQIQPIQGRSYFTDLINHFDDNKVLKLKTNWRQNQKLKTFVKYFKDNGSFNLRSKSQEHVIRYNTISTLYENIERLHKEGYKFITPYNKGFSGTESINNLLSSGKGFQPNDVIIFNSNAGTVIKNQMIGKIIHIEKIGEETKYKIDTVVRIDKYVGEVVYFDDSLGKVTGEHTIIVSGNFSKDSKEPFDLYKSITVTRSQGSEFSKVAVIIPNSNFIDKNLVYTAITRAKDELFILLEDGSENKYQEKLNVEMIKMVTKQIKDNKEIISINNVLCK